jgi:hypothetical protein
LIVIASGAKQSREITAGDYATGSLDKLGMTLCVMWNPFKKNSNGDDTQKMGMLQRVAMRKLEKMSPQERGKMMKEVLSPKNHDKMLKVLDTMLSSGQISQEQYNQAKQKMGS